jgi:hypothetical protein
MSFYIMQKVEKIIATSMKDLFDHTFCHMGEALDQG